jgi:hypothetical protein
VHRWHVTIAIGRRIDLGEVAAAGRGYLALRRKTPLEREASKIIKIIETVEDQATAAKPCVNDRCLNGWRGSATRRGESCF